MIVTRSHLNVIIVFSIALLFLIAFVHSNNETDLIDSINDNGTILHFDELDNSTLLTDLQNITETTSRNPILSLFKSQKLVTSTSPALNLLNTTTNKSTKTPPIRLSSRSKINQLLDAIDNRLKNASMLLDSHVLVLQNANGAVNVTRTWSFQPNRAKNLNLTSTPINNRTLIARIPLSRPFRPHRRLSSHTSRFLSGQQMLYRRKCERLTEQQKYIRLQSVGGLNQQYMANSPLEASRNFPRLLPIYDDPPTSMFSDGTTMFSDASESYMNRPVDPTMCDEQCEEIRTKLEEVLLDDNSRQVPFGRRQMFDGTSGGDESAASEDVESLPEPIPKSKRRGGCHLERFIPVGNCTFRGEEEFWDYEKLCTACQGVYMLSKDCFPTFLNSVVCDKHETNCIFDRYTGVSQGKCRTKKLNFKVMRNKGSKDCEDWEFVYLELPIACECYLSKTSYLDSVPHLPQRN